MNNLPWLLLLGVVLLGIVGQLTLKYGLQQNKSASLVVMLRSWPLWVWFVCYVAATGLWLMVLRELPLHQAFPALGLTYGLIPLASAVVLKERILFGQWWGIALIITGVALVVQS